MDLIDGFWFYEHQEPGIGEYFQTSINADIDSLMETTNMQVSKPGQEKPSFFPQTQVDVKEKSS